MNIIISRLSICLDTKLQHGLEKGTSFLVVCQPLLVLGHGLKEFTPAAPSMV